MAKKKVGELLLLLLFRRSRSQRQNAPDATDSVALQFPYIIVLAVCRGALAFV